MQRVRCAFFAEPRRARRVTRRCAHRREVERTHALRLSRTVIGGPTDVGSRGHGTIRAWLITPIDATAARTDAGGWSCARTAQAPARPETASVRQHRRGRAPGRNDRAASRARRDRVRARDVDGELQPLRGRTTRIRSADHGSRLPPVALGDDTDSRRLAVRPQLPQSGSTQRDWLPAGRGRALAHAIDEFLDAAHREIPRAFESDEYDSRQRELVAEITEEKRALDETGTESWRFKDGHSCSKRRGG